MCKASDSLLTNKLLTELSRKLEIVTGIYGDVSPKGSMCEGLRYAIGQMHTASYKLAVETES